MGHQFANEWLAAWNSHDLERILTHYAEEIVFTSPRAAQRMPHTGGTIRGLDQLREYWEPVFTLRPALSFDLRLVLETVDGCTLLYADERATTVAETMLFGPSGTVVRGVASYAC